MIGVSRIRRKLGKRVSASLAPWELLKTIVLKNWVNSWSRLTQSVKAFIFGHHSAMEPRHEQHLPNRARRRATEGDQASVEEAILGAPAIAASLTGLDQHCDVLGL